MEKKYTFRQECRAYAMITLFQMHIGKFTAEEALMKTAQMLEVEPKDFTKELVLGVSENLEKIDTIIGENINDWKIERVGKIELAVLRIAVYELLQGETPQKVVINEALELVKAFNNDEDGTAKKFTNSVLQNLMSIFVKK